MTTFVNFLGFADLQNYKYFGFGKLLRCLHITPVLQWHVEQFFLGSKVTLYWSSNASFFTDRLFGRRGWYGSFFLSGMVSSPICSTFDGGHTNTGGRQPIKFVLERSLVVSDGSSSSHARAISIRWMWYTSGYDKNSSDLSRPLELSLLVGWSMWL